MQVCKNCGSTEVARSKWVNPNNGEVYSKYHGDTLEWCFGDCTDETTIIETPD